MRTKKNERRGAKSKPAVPYDTDLSYLEHELQWIEARTQRIGAEVRLQRLQDLAGRGRPRGFRMRGTEDLSDADLKRLKDRSGRRERRLRKEVDRRLEAHRAAGGRLALDRMCDSYGLDAFERTVLLLATAPCFERRFEKIYEQLDREEMASGLTVEVVLTFLETPFAERVDRRPFFSPRGRLAANDLVTIEMGHRYIGPKDLLTADIEITGRTFSYLLGDRRLDEEFMEFSSVEEPVASLDQVVLDEALDRRILVKVRFPEPDRQARREIWQRHIPGAAPLADDIDLDALADRYDMAGGYIKNAVFKAAFRAARADAMLTQSVLERAAAEAEQQARGPAAARPAGFGAA